MFDDSTDSDADELEVSHHRRNGSRRWNTRHRRPPSPPPVDYYYNYPSRPPSSRYYHSSSSSSRYYHHHLKSPPLPHKYHRHHQFTSNYQDQHYNLHYRDHQPSHSSYHYHYGQDPTSPSHQCLNPQQRLKPTSHKSHPDLYIHSSESQQPTINPHYYHQQFKSHFKQIQHNPITHEFESHGITQFSDPPSMASDFRVSCERSSTLVEDIVHRANWELCDDELQGGVFKDDGLSIYPDVGPDNGNEEAGTTIHTVETNFDSTHDAVMVELRRVREVLSTLTTTCRHHNSVEPVLFLQESSVSMPDQALNNEIVDAIDSVPQTEESHRAHHDDPASAIDIALIGPHNLRTYSTTSCPATPQRSALFMEALTQTMTSFEPEQSYNHHHHPRSIVEGHPRLPKIGSLSPTERPSPNTPVFPQSSKPIKTKPSLKNKSVTIVNAMKFVAEWFDYEESLGGNSYVALKVEEANCGILVPNENMDSFIEEHCGTVETLVDSEYALKCFQVVAKQSFFEAIEGPIQVGENIICYLEHEKGTRLSVIGFVDILTKRAKNRQWLIAWLFTILWLSIALIPLWLWDERRRDFSLSVFHTHKSKCAMMGVIVFLFFVADLLRGARVSCADSHFLLL